MNHFTNYLQEKRLSVSTINSYSKHIEKFLKWLLEEDIAAETFSYNDLLDFMRYCKTKGVTKPSVQMLLSVVRHYCNYLIQQGRRNDSPATGVYIKGLVRKIPINLLSVEDMEELYTAYQLQLQVDSSKKIMLGLMIYQGLTVGDLMSIQSHHIKIKEGKIYIKGTKRSNERTLTLQAVQIPTLQNYLQKNKFKEGSIFIEARKKEISESNINNRIKYMFTQLQELNPKVINAKQIRSSVITAWLQKNNLRQVQYMAGHKYVSSTERYQLNNLTDLQNQLQEHHPMK